jgi:hypothetical protein
MPPDDVPELRRAVALDDADKLMDDDIIHDEHPKRPIRA